MFYDGVITKPTIDELYHHGIKGQHWGVRNGPPYPLKSKSPADRIYKDANKRIKKISNDVTTACKHTSANMYGLENRLKTKDSISRKIDKKSKEGNISITKASNDIKDAIRFTTISSDNDFVKNYQSMKYELENKGYTETRCKNYWDLYKQGKVKHKSVQSNFSTKDGYEFEIQFHTKSSQDAKNKKLPIYEERRKVDINPKRAIELEKQMDELALKVKEPKDIYKIKSH